jgi:hypothetical protein
MIIKLLIPLLISISTCFIFISILWPDKRFVIPIFFIKFCLSIGLGFGLSSLIFFISFLIFGPSNKAFIVIETTLLVCLIAFFLYFIKSKNLTSKAELCAVPLPKLKIHKALTVSFYFALLSSVITFIFMTLDNPHGLGDALSIWNIRARFLYTDSEQWGNAFSNLLPHSDYPLLVPAFIARNWNYIGNETVIVPSLVAMLFTFIIVGLLLSSLSVLRTSSQGFLSGLVLLGTPFFIRHGASQYADVPLSFFFLATIVLFCLQDKLPEKKHSLVFLAGIATGLSGWTKNEGLLFLLMIVIARFAVIVTLRGWKAYFKEFRLFMFGLMPILIIIFYFKTQIAPQNDLLNLQDFKNTIHRLADFSRYLQVGTVFAKLVLVFDNIVSGIISLLILVLIIMGFKIEKKEMLGIVTSLIALCLMIGGYFFVYIITPHSIQWHMKTSLNRIFLQLWPSILFICFLIARTFERSEAIGRRR